MFARMIQAISEEEGMLPCWICQTSGWMHRRATMREKVIRRAGRKSMSTTMFCQRKTEAVKRWNEDNSNDV